MAADQAVKGGTTPGTPPVRKKRRAWKVKIRYADEAARVADQSNRWAPVPDGTKAKRVATEFGPGRKVVLVPPAEDDDEAEEAGDLMVEYVKARLREAGKTLALMPGIGGGFSEREYPLPDPEAIGRMDEVLQDWLPSWCRSHDHRRILSWFTAGLSWRKAAKKDPEGRSHEALRKIFLAVVADLAQQVVARGKVPPKWLLTELTKKG